MNPTPSLPAALAAAPLPAAGATADGTARARELARRYRCEFVDLKDYRIDPALFRTVSVISKSS